MAKFNDERIKALVPQLFFHSLFWAIFISYEVYVSNAISHEPIATLDYILHYLVYILFFYIHAYVVLGNTYHNGKIYTFKLASLIAVEIAGLYICNLIIHYFLLYNGITPKAISPLLIESFYATAYRAVWLMILSTAYFLGRASLEHQKEKLQKEKEEEKLRADLAESNLAFLKAQINPHFLFNQLTEIYTALRDKESPGSERLMALAELMQYAVVAEETDMKISLSAEINYLKNYIQLKRLEYPGRIDFRIIHEEDFSLENKKVMPVILTTLVENVFKHAEISTGSKPARIKLKLTNKGIRLHIKNDRNRNNQTQGNGIGMKNLMARLSHFYKDNFSLLQKTTRNSYQIKLFISLNS
jgi:two-component system LytT family sensor kinase